MNLLQIPYIQNAIINDARRTALVNRIVNRIAATQRDEMDYIHATDFFLRLNEAAEQLANTQRADDTDAMLADYGRTLVRNIATTLANGHNLFYPIATLNLNRRNLLPSTIENTLRDCFEPSNSNADRARIYDLLSCVAEISDCDECGTTHASRYMTETYRDGTVCQECIDDHYTHSDYYSGWIRTNDSQTAYDEDGDEVLILEGDRNFVYDDDREEYVHRNAVEQIIKPYHNSKSYFHPILTDWTDRTGSLMGVELEVEAHSGEPNTLARRIHETVNENVFGRRVFFERDGSLNNGFEIITQPMGLPMIRSTFEFLKNQNLTRGLRSHRTTTCGLHVHVSRQNLTNVQIARAVVFVNDPRNDAFVTALARRYNTTFCQAREKQIDTAALPGDRYEAVNLTGRHTIEFRIFRGSLKYEAVIAAAEFCHALLEYCKREPTSTTQLNARDFLAWCAADYIEETETLRAYVADRTAGVFALDEAAA
jgi:hypothetical protein